MTGSVGKTTTKEMLRTVLAAQAPTHAAVASYNNHWGLPLTLARLPPDAAFCVAEIGMNHAGEIAPLARLARPHVAVITAIDARAYRAISAASRRSPTRRPRSCAGLEPGGIAVLPADYAACCRACARAAGGARIVTFGAGDAADARLVAAETDADGTDVARTLPAAVRVHFAWPRPAGTWR